MGEPIRRRPVLPRSDPPVVYLGFGFDKDRILGYALHEKCLQGQIGVGTLVSSQEQRAAVVLRINRLSTVGFVPPPGLHTKSFGRASEECFKTAFFDAPAGKRVGIVLGEPFRRPVLPSTALPGRPAPTRPWYFRVLDSTNVKFRYGQCGLWQGTAGRGTGRGGAGRGEARRGGAGQSAKGMISRLRHLDRKMTAPGDPAEPIQGKRTN